MLQETVSVAYPAVHCGKEEEGTRGAQHPLAAVEQTNPL